MFPHHGQNAVLTLTSTSELDTNLSFHTRKLSELHFYMKSQLAHSFVRCFLQELLNLGTLLSKMLPIQSQSSTITLWLACRREAICRHFALLAALSTRERNAMMTRLTVCCPQRNERLRTLPRCLRQVQQCSRQTYDCVIQVQICNGVVHVQAPPPCKRTDVNASSQRSGRTKTIAPQSCPIGNLVHDTCRLSSLALLAVGLQSGRQGGLAGVENTSLLQL